MWCIPPQQNAAFVAKMEDVLDLYALPYDAACPVICLDEKPYQLIGERREILPMKPGVIQRVDNEYERNGTCSIFVFCEPLKGWTHASVRERRTAIDFAYEIDYLLSESPYKDVPKIRLVVDNLNTHVIASLYKVFSAEKARGLARRLEFHYTPCHGSWLNVAEISISVLSKQCVGRRISDIGMLRQEILAWEKDYNMKGSGVDWQFTTDDARIKLKRLYPVLYKN